MHTQHDVATDPVQMFLKSLTPEQLTELKEQLHRPQGDERPITQKDLSNLLLQGQRRHNNLADGVRELESTQRAQHSRISALETNNNKLARQVNTLESNNGVFSGFESYGTKLKLENYEDRLNKYNERIRALEVRNRDVFEPAATVLAGGLAILLLVTIIKVATAPTVVTEAAPA